ncbi:MAG TPA: tetratricopeptide repeat protein [Geobacteraceae bacterium]
MTERSNSSDCRPAGVNLIVATIVLCTLLAYGRVVWNGFIDYDDLAYISSNPVVSQGLSLQGISWAFSLDRVSQAYWHPDWYPVTWLSLMLDCQLFGPSPVAIHLVNLVLHLVNALLLFAILGRLTRACWPSAAVALLFALHPLNVESVAWAVERKSLLNGLFWMLTLWLYLGYVARPRPGRYLVMWAAFVLGMLARPAIAALPGVMLLLDFWPLGRLAGTGPSPAAAPAADGLAGKVSLRHALLEKVPLLLSALAIIGAVLYSTRAIAPSLDGGSVPFTERSANALVSYGAYLLKMLWPAHLGIYYPPRPQTPVVEVAAAVLFLTGVTLVAVRYRRSRPWLLTGWLWYLGALVPVIGLVRSGHWPAMADRYAYLPLIGVFVMLVWELHHQAMQRHWSPRLLAAGTASVLVALLGTTIVQVGYWKDDVSIFEHTARVTSGNLFALRQVGFDDLEAGRYDQAFAALLRVRDLDPRSVDYDYAVARVLSEKGEYREALALFKGALASDEGLRTLKLLGSVYLGLGERDLAVETFNKMLVSSEYDGYGFKQFARGKLQELEGYCRGLLDPLRRRVEQSPRNLQARGELAIRLDTLGFYAEALQHYREMERLDPDNWRILYNAGNACYKTGRLAEAARYLERGRQKNPANVDLLNTLGVVYKKMGRYDRAVEAFTAALTLVPAYPLASYNLAGTYLLMRDRQNAIRMFTLVRDRYPQLREAAVANLRMLEKER